MDQHLDYIRLASGGVYWPRSPRWNDVHIEDIAAGLSKLCRFTGQCDRFYSVAEHSVHVSYLVPPLVALAALLHDATEAFIADLNTPTKRGTPEYRAIEMLNEEAICTRFGIDIADFHVAAIHRADARMFEVEYSHFFPAQVGASPTPLPPELKTERLGVSWQMAHALFLARFASLGGDDASRGMR